MCWETGRIISAPTGRKTQVGKQKQLVLCKDVSSIGIQCGKIQYQKRTVERVTFQRILVYTESGLSETGEKHGFRLSKMI